MDALTEILNTLRMSSSLYFRTELSSPWGVEVPKKANVARFHIVIRGQCWLKIDNDEAIYMSNGDLVIIPHGASHTLADKPTTSIRPLSEVLDEVSYEGEGPLVYGGGGAGCCLVCGEFSFDDLGNHPLLENLPTKLYLSGRDTYNTLWLDSALGFIAHEAAKLDSGAHAIIDRLSEIILIQVIRATLDSSITRIPFLSAFTDARIKRVLSAIHAKPEENWSVERLGRLVNMSRSSFSNRFSELVSMTPLQYVILVRLQKASRLLTETSTPLIAVAEGIGYQSEAAFSQAFKKQYGMRPGEFRRIHSRMAA
ncbi:AraC family transcriptional regulator [Agaribacter marinus]|uniref:AraC family transcriptional regulator n=1 Tax=Agaribacter marinus TaxID=1431249 RepID=A0AA37WIW5_9ALTE|nr:AraC family transcriptional regulator [Agaribacter marinus]GLR72391.1 AraC family transcriptional regulator [Agaribacter marinus]